MQTFNHNNYYIVMERGKFLYYATFICHVCMFFWVVRNLLVRIDIILSCA